MLHQDGAVMVEFDKCKRCVSIAYSWCGKTFDQVHQRRNSKPEFAQEWKSAESKYETLDNGEELDWPCPASFHHLRSAGCRMEVIFWFIAIFEFHKKYGIDPKQVGLNVVSLVDELNKVMKGVLVKPVSGMEQPDFARRVVIWSEKCWIIDEEKVVGSKRLRENQADEATAYDLGQDIKTRPQDSSNPHVHFVRQCTLSMLTSCRRLFYVSAKILSFHTSSKLQGFFGR